MIVRQEYAALKSRCPLKALSSDTVVAPYPNVNPVFKQQPIARWLLQKIQPFISQSSIPVIECDTRQSSL